MTDLDGKYRLLRLIGTGAMGAVYESEHLLTGRRVAVKLLHSFSHDFSEIAAARFRREAKASARISHPAMVEILDAGDSNGQRYLVFELLRGESLASHFEARTLPTRDLIRAMADVLDVLELAHSQGFIHRDVKPENIFVDRDDRGVQVKLLDFGIVRDLTDRERITVAGTLLGTPDYMSPEQALGAEATVRSDLWSAGAVLYHGLAGQPPFVAENRVEVLRKIVNEEPLPLPGEVPPALRGVVMRALAKAPHDRFESAAEMRSRLLACYQLRWTLLRRGALALLIAGGLSMLSPALERSKPEPLSIEPVSEVLPRELEILSAEPAPKQEVKPRRPHKQRKKRTQIELIREYR